MPIPSFYSDITGRDDDVLTQALALALVAVDSLPEEWRDTLLVSDMHELIAQFTLTPLTSKVYFDFARFRLSQGKSPS